MQRALSLAAAQAAAGHLDGRIEATLSANGCGDVFPERAALAAAAQSHWWQRLLGRLDALIDDDVAGIPGDATTSAIQAAWTATVRDLPGYLALSASAAGSVKVRRDLLRYARLLALFAGQAGVDEDPIVAARTGLALVELLSSAATSAATATASATKSIAASTATPAAAKSTAATTAFAATLATTSVSTATAAGAAMLRPLTRLRRALTLSR